ncbi:MAG: response regulator transcription factor [Planctomycetota bacterium]
MTTKTGRSQRVLVVDDEADIAELLEINLARAGFEVATASDGRTGLARIKDWSPDLVVLDVMMPELSGTEVASRVRSDPATSSLPILMLTAKAEEVDEVVGLTVGADDYVTKPFSVKVLIARIESLLRRAAGPVESDGALLRVGPVSLDMETHDVSVDGDPVKLTLTEFRLLAALMEARGKVLSRQDLMSNAMGPGVTVTERTIDVHVTAIRKKLGPHSSLVQTVRGVGYRMAMTPARAGA